MFRLCLAVLLTACSSTAPSVRRVVVPAPAGETTYASEADRCRVLCARFAKPNEGATCHRATGTAEFNARHGADKFYVCRLERK